MKPALRFTILAAVVIAIGAVLALKFRQAEATAAVAPRAGFSAKPSRASVLLFADLREANEGEDGCALIIRAVRSARQRGLAITEYDAGSSPDVRKRYRVMVEPTVIVLDSGGHEIARYQGEDAATLAAIRAEIARLSGGAA